jgi:hypothetical protein
MLSFDGTTYRLHSGKDGTVVFEVSQNDLDSILNTATTSDVATKDSSLAMPFVIGGVSLAVVLVAIMCQSATNPRYRDI